jgi:hypothetical protein
LFDYEYIFKIIHNYIKNNLSYEYTFIIFAKNEIMKTSIILKAFVVLPILMFVDYILMVILGCATCLLGFGNDFYCGSYCIIGKIILGLSSMIFLFIMFPDFKE